MDTKRPAIDVIHERRRYDSSEVRSERIEGKGMPDIVGYAAVFNEVIPLDSRGKYTEEVAPGAFSEALARHDDVRALFNHDPSSLLGRTKANTLQLAEDDKGLFVRILPPDDELGRRVIGLIERGDLSQMSFGFSIEKEEVVKEEGKPTHFIIRQVKLYDVSPVTFPAYPMTEVEIKRSIQSRLVVEDGRAEKALRDRKRRMLIMTCK